MIFVDKCPNLRWRQIVPMSFYKSTGTKMFAATLLEVLLSSSWLVVTIAPIFIAQPGARQCAAESE